MIQKLRQKTYVDMEVDETQLGSTAIKEDEETQKEYQRKREHGRRVAREALASARIAREESLERRHKEKFDITSD